MNPHFSPKNYLLLSLFFMTIGSNCLAQDYRLISENKLWSNYVFEYESEYLGYAVYHSYYIKAVDVIYDRNEISCRLMRSDFEDMSNWYDYGYLWETGRDVYYQKEGESSWELLYSFYAQVGDTVTVYAWANENWCEDLITYVVDSIDTIDVLGVERKRMLMAHLEWGGIAEEWIFGIGSVSGLLYNNTDCTGCDLTDLLCVWESDTLVYGDGSCFRSSVGISETDMNEPVEIYPNPASQRQTIHITINKPLSLPRAEIYNALGQQVDAFTLESDIVSFDILHGQGLYFIRVLDGNELIGTMELVVH